jgi:hypothetical protein
MQVVKNIKQVYIVFAYLFSFATLCSCGTIPNLNVESIPDTMDFHSVGPAFGFSRFNLTSINEINRSVVGSYYSDISLQNIQSDSIGNWTWVVYSTSSLMSIARVLETDRTVMVNKGASAYSIEIPSINTAMMKVHELLSVIIGKNKLLPLNLDIALYPTSVHVSTKETLHSNSAIPMHLAMGASEKIVTDGDEAFQWILGTADLVSHEYWHAYNRESKNAHFINMLTEEVTAYTIGTCAELVSSNRKVTFYLIDKGGVAIDVDKLEQSRIKLLSGAKSKMAADLSYEGRLYAIYNIAYILQTNILRKQDIDLQNRLLKLCSAMVSHPVDMTAGFYPRNLIDTQSANLN